jgi:uncharacterized membrane protein YeaQ/YmgE (transglycosylase-associated protein family)
LSSIAWIVLGLLAGMVAKAIMPGGERLGPSAIDNRRFT